MTRTLKEHAQNYQQFDSLVNICERKNQDSLANLNSIIQSNDNNTIKNKTQPKVSDSLGNIGYGKNNINSKKQISQPKQRKKNDLKNKNIKRMKEKNKALVGTISSSLHTCSNSNSTTYNHNFPFYLQSQKHQQKPQQQSKKRREKSNKIEKNIPYFALTSNFLAAIGDTETKIINTNIDQNKNRKHVSNRMRKPPSNTVSCFDSLLTLQNKDDENNYYKSNNKNKTVLSVLSEITNNNHTNDDDQKKKRHNIKVKSRKSKTKRYNKKEKKVYVSDEDKLMDAVKDMPLTKSLPKQNVKPNEKVSILEDIQKENIMKELQPRCSSPVTQVASVTFDTISSSRPSSSFQMSNKNNESRIIFSSVERQAGINKGLDNISMFTPQENSPNACKIPEAMLMRTPNNSKNSDRTDEDLIHDIMNHPMQNISIYFNSSCGKKKEKKSVAVSFSPQLKVYPIPNIDDSFLSTDGTKVELLKFNHDIAKDAKRLLSPQYVSDTAPSLVQPEKKLNTRKTPKAITDHKLKLKDNSNLPHNTLITESDRNAKKSKNIIFNVYKRIFSPNINDPQSKISLSLLQPVKRQGLRKTPDAIIQRKEKFGYNHSNEAPLSKDNNKTLPTESNQSIPRVLNYDTVATNASLNFDLETKEDETIFDVDNSLLLDQENYIGAPPLSLEEQNPNGQGIIFLDDQIQPQEFQDNSIVTDLEYVTCQNFQQSFQMKPTVADLEHATFSSFYHSNLSFIEVDTDNDDLQSCNQVGNEKSILDKDEQEINEWALMNPNDDNLGESGCNTIFDIEKPDHSDNYPLQTSYELTGQPLTEKPIFDNILARKSSRQTKTVKRLNIRWKKKKKSKTPSNKNEDNTQMTQIGERGTCTETVVDLTIVDDEEETNKDNNDVLHSEDYEMICNSFSQGNDKMPYTHSLRTDILTQHDDLNTSIRRSSREKKAVDRYTLKFKRKRLRYRDHRNSKAICKKGSESKKKQPTLHAEGKEQQSFSSSPQQNVQIAAVQNGELNCSYRRSARDKKAVDRFTLKFKRKGRNNHKSKSYYDKVTAVSKKPLAQKHSQLKDMPLKSKNITNDCKKQINEDDQQFQKRHLQLKNIQSRYFNLFNKNETSSQIQDRQQPVRNRNQQRQVINDELSLSKQSKIQNSPHNNHRRSSRTRKQVNRLTLKFKRKKKKPLDFRKKTCISEKQCHIPHSRDISYEDGNMPLDAGSTGEGKFNGIFEPELAQIQTQVQVSPHAIGYRRSTRPRKQVDRLSLKFRRHRLKRNRKKWSSKHRSNARKSHVEEEVQEEENNMKSIEEECVRKSYIEKEAQVEENNTESIEEEYKDFFKPPQAAPNSRSARSMKQVDRSLKFKSKRKYNKGFSISTVNINARDEEISQLDADEDYLSLSNSEDESEYIISNTHKQKNSPITNDNQWSKDQLVHLHTSRNRVNPTSSTFWHDVADFVPDRTAQQCHDQWFQSPDKQINKPKEMTTNDEDDEDDIFNSTPMKGLLCNYKSFSPSPIQNSPRDGNFIFTQDDDNSIFSPAYSPPIVFAAQKGYIKRLAKRNRRIRLVPSTTHANKPRKAKAIAEVAVGNNILKGKLNFEGRVEILDNGINSSMDDDELFFSSCSDDGEEDN